MILIEIIKELKRIQYIAYLNRFNTFNNNIERTKDAVKDFLNTDWEQVIQ